MVSPGSRREIYAWAMYDWASSAYSALSITVLVLYLKETVNAWSPDKGGLVWGFGLTVTMMAAAVLSPVLGAIADAAASKRKWLAGTAFTGAAAAVLMFFATPDRPLLLIALFLGANLAFELSLCFYNGFLPEIAEESQMNRVSALGFSFGYLGGGMALALAIGMIYFGHWIGLPRSDQDTGGLLPRLGLLVMGLWWGLFTVPTIWCLKDKRLPDANRKTFLPQARAAMAEVVMTLRNVRRYRTLATFLLAFLIYNDGVQTVINQSSIYANEFLKMKTGELCMVILMIQFVAMPGAWMVGKLADRLGQKPTLILCLFVWIALLAVALFITSKPKFWCMAVVVALVLGGTQSVSRAIMGVMTPPERAAEFFGFFSFSGKATGGFGSSFFATIKYLTGSAQLSLASLLVFFVTGWAIVQRVSVAKGRQEAGRLPVPIDDLDRALPRDVPVRQ